MCLFTNKKKIKINIHQEIILSEINRNLDELNKNILSLINRKEKNTYTREYNLIHIIVGSIAIFLSIASTVSSLMILGYLSKNESKNLFHEVIYQNFLSIIIPITIFMFFIIMALIISTVRYEMAIKKEFNIKSKLITLHILELIHFLLIIPLLIKYEILPLSPNINNIIISFLTFFKDAQNIIILLYVIIIIFHICILTSMKNEIKFCDYILFSSCYVILFPVGILIYTGVLLESKDISVLIFLIIYILFIAISFFSNLYYINHINKENKPSIFLYCLFYILSVITLSMPFSNGIDFTQNSLVALSIRDRENKQYLVNDYFVKLHDLKKENYKERKIEKGKENEIFYIVCAKRLFKTDKTSLIETNKIKVQIPNELIHLDQHGSQCNSQNEEK